MEQTAAGDPGANMTALDQLIPEPRLREIERVGVRAPAWQVWERARHGDLAGSRLPRALFALRTLVGRRKPNGIAPTGIRIDDLRSSPEHPGFQILVDGPPREVAVAAIGQVWRLNIPFVHVASPADYAAFVAPGFIKVAWSIRVLPRAENAALVEFEVRVAATDDASWRKFRRYFFLIGPWSRFIRRSALRKLARSAFLPGSAAPVSAPTST